MKTWNSVLSVAIVVLLGTSAWAAPTVSTKGDTKNVQDKIKHLPKQSAKASVATSSAASSGPIGQITNPIFSSGPAGGTAIDFQRSMKILKEGDSLAEQGNWNRAASDYQQALTLWADNSEAMYGLGRCALATGDILSALSSYRQRIYARDPSRYGTVPGDGYQENRPQRLMEYVLLLERTGQSQEAMRVYNRAVDLVDYDPANGNPREKVLLPEFGTALSQTPCTPQRLQAMAHLALGMELFASSGYVDKKPLVQFQQAVKLAPDSAAAHFYLGKYLFGKNDPGAKTELQEAVRLGDDQTAAAAKEYLK